MPIPERVQQTFDELAQAIREQCGCDDLRLHLEGTPDVLADWTQTSSVVSTPRSTPEPAKAPAEVKPAA